MRHNMKTLSLLLGLLLAGPSLVLAEKPSAAPTNVSTGVFAGIEQGDYFYLKLKPSSGEEESFMILDDGNGLKAFVDKPKKFMGKKIRVEWQEREVEIPEAGGKIQTKVAVGAKKL